MEEAIAKSYWHHALQSAFADYMADRVDVTEARNRVSRALSDMKHSDPVDPRTKQLDTAIASYEILTRPNICLKEPLKHYFR